MEKSKKVIVVMPAYNAAQTLEKTVADIPFSYIDELIIVDDASRDDTVKVAQEMVRNNPNLEFADVSKSSPGKTLVTIHRHEKNLGYGGNQKTCYRLALKQGADIVIMVHPDFQYDPRLVKHFVEFIKENYFDVMLGSRIRSRKETLAGGMPLYKYLANRFLTLLENSATGQNFSEWHTGMRAYSHKVLQSIDFHKFSDDFVFDTQMLMAIVERDFLVGDIPVPVRYFKEASSINFRRSVRYGLTTVWEVLKFLGRKVSRKKL